MKKVIASLLSLFIIATPTYLMANVKQGKKAMQTIQVEPNKNSFKVKLDANATTGYQWFLSGYDKAQFKLVSYKYITPQTDHVGAGGQAEFSFSVINPARQVPQMSKLHFTYAQAWNMTNSTDTTITVFMPAQ